MLKEFVVNDMGNKTLAFVSGANHLLCGSRAGELAIIDLRQRTIVSQAQIHDGSIKAVVVNEAAGLYATGASDGIVKLWSLSTHRQIDSLVYGPRGTFINNEVIADIVLDRDVMFVCGSDGMIKAAPLPKL